MWRMRKEKKEIEEVRGRGGWRYKGYMHVEIDDDIVHHILNGP
jgi:hypothetical protein